MTIPTMLGAEHGEDVMFPPGLEVPSRFKRTGSKESTTSRASHDSMPPGVWSFAGSDVSTRGSTRVSSPKKARESQPPGIFRVGSNQSTAPSTPPEEYLPGLPLALDSKSQAFYLELLQRTSQLQQVADEDLETMSFGYRASGVSVSASTCVSGSVSPCRSPMRRQQQQQSMPPKMSLPLASLVGSEGFPAMTDSYELSTPPPGTVSGSVSPDRGRSPKKGKKAKQPPPTLEDLEGLPSRGSKNHEKGQCRPCRDFWKPQGCASGVLCNFCHCDHGEQKSAAANCEVCCDTNCSGDACKDTFVQEAPRISMNNFRPPPGLSLPLTLPPGL